MDDLKELMPAYDGAKSFYKKAFYRMDVEKADDLLSYEIYKLYSYNTLVCEIIYIKDGRNNRMGCYYKLNKYSFYSNTTARHVKEFIKQFLKYNDVKRILIDGNYTRDVIKNITRLKT